MADNVELNAGTGGVQCLTDECGAGVHAQVIKLAYSGDGVATRVLIDAKGLQVQQATAADLNATITGTVTANLGATDNAVLDDLATSLAALDNAVDGNYLNVNQNIAGTDVAAGAGAVSAQVQRMTLASDDPAVAALGTIHGHVDSIDGKMTACNTGAVVLAAGTAEVGKLAAGTALIGKVGIDQLTANANEVVVKSGTVTTVSTVTAVTAITNALPAGTNAIGKLAANDGVDIGNVDVASVPAPLSVVGAGTEAAAMRVTIANDSTGVLSVDDNGAALTVDNAGTFAVQATLAAETTKVIGTVNISASQTVGIAAGTAGIGKLTANSGVDIGDVDVTSLPALPAGTNLIGDVNLGLRASGGGTPYSYISDGTDFVSVTDGATTLYAISCTSTDATVIYIKFYDKATAPDPSADAASIKLRFAVPSLATGAGFVWSVPQGMDFPTGLGFALVTGAADTDETAVTANEVMVNLVYKH